MISKTSTGYWSTGITVKFSPNAGGNRPGWCASLDFLDDGFLDDDPDAGVISTQGTLTTRYFVSDGEHASGLSAAIDALVADAAKLGITLGISSPPQLYYAGDGEDPDSPPPLEWRALLAAEAARIGWEH